MRWVLIGLSIWLLNGMPCESCGENPLCLSRCAYEALLAAKTPKERLGASLILAHAWLRGDFAEGVPSLLWKTVREREEIDSLTLHAQLLLVQAYHKLQRTDSAILLCEQVAEQAKAYPFLKARAHLGLASLLARRDLLRAFIHASEAAELSDALQNPLLNAIAYSQLAYLTAEQRNLSEALSYALKAMEAAEKAKAASTFLLLLESPSSVYLASLTNLASIYAEIGRGEEAENLYKKALREAQQDSLAIGHITLGLGALYLQTGKVGGVEELLRKYGKLWLKLPYELRREAFQLQVSLYTAQNRPAFALKAYEEWLTQAEKEMQRSQSTRLEQLRVLSGLEFQESQLKLIKTQQRQERILYAVIAALGILVLGGLGYAVYAARRRVIEERSFREIITSQSQKIDEQAKALERQNQELLRISETLAEALATVQESYIVARRLQRAIFPDVERILPGSILHYQPLHEVGGDFYAVAAVPSSARLFFMVGDATGHGISGAILASIFSSMAQGTFLRNPTDSPQLILHELQEGIRNISQAEGELVFSNFREGADLALGIADFRSQKIYFALAGRPVWLLDGSTLRELDGGRRGIDSFTIQEYQFPTYEEPMSPSLTLFLFTDGVTDVLNPEGRKLGIRALRNLFQNEEFLSLPDSQKRERLIQLLEEWRNGAQPNDDITFVFLPVSSLYAYAEKRFGLKFT
ncbi:MAG: SpoIIE family protein phosphatase [Bacteroidia bacterium]|nr:SpoIIE family protein phosphatase [Bacteroidia bacterium]MDW8015636.1 SpoIIE family protein phosphatase [Bacteroidia bacterium]